jgi:peptidoglycan/LPS O-acetylase OafA/YrhL
VKRGPSRHPERYNWSIVAVTDQATAARDTGLIARPAPPIVPSSAGYLAALTGLRFWLALWVILHHPTGPRALLGAWTHTLPAWTAGLVRGGYLSVNVFFVLSGFVLALGYSSSKWNRGRLLQYGVRRVARIYPLYALSLALMIPFIISDRLPWTGASWESSKAALVANYVLVLQGWSGKLPVNWNTPAWSLSCELFFYALFPLIIAVLRRRRWPVYLAVLLGSILLPGALRLAGIPGDWKPLMHAADFLIGIAAAGLYNQAVRRGRFAGQGHWVYFPAIGIVALLIACPALVARWIDLNSALRPLCAAIVFGIALGGGWLTRALATRPAVHLGHASYAIYILHIPIMWWFKCWLGPLFGVLPGGWLALAYLIPVLAISSLVFQYFEEPVNRWVRMRYARSSARITGVQVGLKK